MTYKQAIQFINSTLVFGSKPGLSRIGRLLELLGNPQDNLKFIHLAGTNGKGSTSAFISSCLQEAGYKTGLYISPFVIDFRERIQINGEYISKRALSTLMNRIKPLCERMAIENESPTEFEIITALAFLYFKKQKCEYVVLETGLGGRFDATNIIKAPLLCVITSISFDHMQYLGNNLEKIAFEKCGIIKNGGRTVVYPLQDEKAFSVITNRAKEENNECIIPDLNSLNIISSSLFGTNIVYKNLSVFIPLTGNFQIYNAITAIEALLALQIPHTAIINGIKEVHFPARFEIISKEPLIIIDGAHNEDGIYRLIESINSHLFGKNLIVIMGMLKDKAYDEAISKISALSHTFIAVTPNNSRGLEASETAKIAKMHCKNVIISKNFKNATKKALSIYKKDSAILVCGSLYIAGELRENFLKKL